MEKEVDEAKAILEQHKKDNVAAAGKELNELLAKYNVTLTTHQEIIGGQFGPIKIMLAPNG